MNRLFSRFTSQFSRWARSLALLLALSGLSPACAQVGADFGGGLAKLEAGAVVVYALLGVLLVMSFSIAIAHYVRAKAFERRWGTEDSWDDTND